MGRFVLEPEEQKPAKPRFVVEPSNIDAYKETAQESSALENFMAGVGGAMYAPYLGVKQMIGMADKGEVADYEEAMRGLNSTTSGKIGSFAGAVAPVAATATIPGANTLVGSTMIGALSGATQPVYEGGPGRFEQGAMGAVGGAAGKVVGDKVAGYVSNKVGNLVAQKGAEQSRNAVRDATLKASQAQGYVVPPSYAKSGLGSRVLEGISGKYKTNQLARIKNQEITDSMARKALNIADDQPLSDAALETIRKTEGKAYADIAALGNDAADALEKLKEARFQRNAYMKHYDRTADPASLAQSKTFKQQADALEKFLESKVANDPAKMAALKAAREKIAKTYTVERALNDATGNVDATKIGAMLDKGAPLSGELEQIGRFANAYRDVAKVPASGDANPFTILDMAYALPAGAVNPAAYALPLARVGARQAILSKPYQKAFVGPNYEVGRLTRKLPDALNNPYTQLLYPGIGVGLLGPGLE